MNRLKKGAKRDLTVRLLHLVTLAGALQAGAQTQYIADGVPTGLEEEIRWRVNRGRYDTASENQARGTAYTDVPATSGPLAPNQSISLACRHHSEDMARNNVFQHATVDGSAYYDPATQPNPWDRMRAEGYVWNQAAENIAAGYSGAETVYLGWWNSSGHRHNMYNGSLREIGNGYFYWSPASYDRYYTMDLGSSGNNCFLTDTLFRDVNGNGIYDQAEAVSGVAVTLVVGSNTQHSFYDLSSAVGSFAIPIQSIATGSTVQVVLSNTTTATLLLSVPRGFQTYASITLSSGERKLYGTFNRSVDVLNVGLRNVTPSPAEVAPTLTVSRTGPNILLAWPSVNGVQYQLQWSTNLQSWTSVTNGAFSGTGANLTYQDAGALTAGRKSYRLLVTRP